MHVSARTECEDVQGGSQQLITTLHIPDTIKPQLCLININNVKYPHVREAKCKYWHQYCIKEPNVLIKKVKVAHTRLPSVGFRS